MMLKEFKSKERDIFITGLPNLEYLSHYVLSLGAGRVLKMWFDFKYHSIKNQFKTGFIKASVDTILWEI